ncbi:MAG: hypothetical protein WC742_14075 [Gallionellaceae bacterium]|jgi:hypothetical protein
MKIQYDKNEIIAAARYIVKNKPSAKAPSQIPYTDRGFQPERGHVDAILGNIRALARENEKVYLAAQQSLAAGNSDVDLLWRKWVEVLGVGGYWIIANIEADTINFAIAVSPWFGAPLYIHEEI